MNLWEVVVLFIVLYFLRFAIIKFNFKNVSQFSLMVLLFFILRISFTVNENRREEILVHEYKKGKIFSIKKGNAVCFWIENLDDKNKILQYIINPYNSSRRIQKVIIKKLPVTSGKIVFNNKTYNLK
jgi:competence protein ComEC